MKWSRERYWVKVCDRSGGGEVTAGLAHDGGLVIYVLAVFGLVCVVHLAPALCSTFCGVMGRV